MWNGPPGQGAQLVLVHLSVQARTSLIVIFPSPVGSRGPLRGWAEALLDERRMREDGYLDPTFVRRRWTAFLAGVDDWRTSLWPILMWQAWREATQ